MPSSCPKVFCRRNAGSLAPLPQQSPSSPGSNAAAYVRFAAWRRWPGRRAGGACGPGSQRARRSAEVTHSSAWRPLYGDARPRPPAGPAAPGRGPRRLQPIAAWHGQRWRAPPAFAASCAVRPSPVLKIVGLLHARRALVLVGVLCAMGGAAAAVRKRAALARSANLQAPTTTSTAVATHLPQTPVACVPFDVSGTVIDCCDFVYKKEDEEGEYRHRALGPNPG